MHRQGWRAQTRCLLATALLLCAPGCAVLNSGRQPVHSPWLVPLDLAGGTFDLKSPAQLRALADAVDGSIARAKADDDLLDARRKRMRQEQELSELPADQLREYFSDPSAFISKKEKRGLEWIRSALAEFQAAEPRERGHLAGDIQELARAINNNRRPPAPPRIEVLTMPLLLADYMHNPIGRGTVPASNVPAANDPSRADPSTSTFWRRPAAIPELDLYAGFGRRNIPPYTNWLCHYKAPKTSFGGNPGFELASADASEIKVKFGEILSEPFTARIFWALGYHVDPTDFTPFMRLEYDRRLFREFHLRKPIRTRFHFLGIPTFGMDQQRVFDPFESIETAIFKDGRTISGPDLKLRLLEDPLKTGSGDDPANFDAAVEKELRELVTRPANVQQDTPGFKSIGPWDFDQLGHEHLRELRGAALLSAWLGFFDSRWENTRLKAATTGSTTELRHFFADVGGGLGKSRNALRLTSESPNDFPWTFTAPEKFQGEGRMTLPFRIVNFAPIEDTLAFERMTLDDARWMARLIAQLTENQLAQALIAAGADSALARLYLDKLVSRRDRMLRDLGLSAEFQPLRPGGINARFSYDPAQEGPMRAHLPDGTVVTAPLGESVIRQGVWQPRVSR